MVDRQFFDVVAQARRCAGRAVNFCIIVCRFHFLHRGQHLIYLFCYHIYLLGLKSPFRAGRGLNHLLLALLLDGLALELNLLLLRLERLAIAVEALIYFGQAQISVD